EVVSLEKRHTELIETEKLLGKSTEGNGRSRALSTVVLPSNRGERESIHAPAIIKQTGERSPLDYFVRTAAILHCAKATNRPTDEVRQRMYGDDETTKVVFDIVMRAASAPALTTVTGWAAELVQQTYTDLMPLLMPKAILTRLAPRGLTLS